MIPSLNFAVLTDALFALKEGHIHHCEALGFTFEEMNILSQLSLDELVIISRTSVPFMSVTLRHDTFRQIIALSRQEVQRLHQINRAIRLGASIALLSRYFGLTSNEICLRRRVLGVTVPPGRTPVPDEETDTEIWRHWQKHRVDNPESSAALEAMMRVTEALSSQPGAPSLTVVWNRITLCEEKTINRRSPHAG